MKFFGKAEPAEEVSGEWIFDAVREVALRAQEGPEPARQAMLEAIAANVDGADGMLVVEHDGTELRVASNRGRRFEHFAGAAVQKELPLDGPHMLEREQLVHPGDRHGMIVPIEGEITGVGRAAVYVASSGPAFLKGAFEDLVDFVSIAGPVYALCRAREQDQNAAYYDGLTGVLRPNTMRTRLRELVRSGKHLAFAFVDGDNFKLWNDRYGHASGDLVIQHIAAAVSQVKLSCADLVGRMGGDEFGIAFVGASKADAVKQSLRLCIELARADLTEETLTGETPEVKVTASVGVAVLGDDAETESELLKRADEAVYESKRQGRDCVTYYDRGQFVTATQEERRTEETRMLELLR